MRVGFLGIIAGLSTAISLKKEGSLTSSVVTLSLATELLVILIFGCIEVL